MSSCIWINSFEELEDIHPQDLFANWSGVKLEVGDMAFLVQEDDCWFYYMAEYAAVAIDDPPYVVTGLQDDTTDLYPIWRIMSLSYTVQAVGVDGLGDTVYPTDTDEERNSTYDFLSKCALAPELLFSAFNVVATTPPNATQTKQLRSTTSSLWTEEALAELDWNADNLSLESDFVAYGGLYEKETYFDQAKSNPGFACKIGCLNDPRLVIVSKPLGTSPYITHCLYEYNEAGTGWTLKDSLNVDSTHSTNAGGTADFDTHCYNCSLGGDSNQYYVVGFPDYTDSKPEQGYLELIEINTDLTLTRIAAIDNPDGAGRYAHFGDACAVLETSSELYVLASFNDDEIVVMDETSSWAADGNTIALASGDIGHSAAGDPFVDRFFYSWWDDSASGYSHAMVYNNGTNWVMATAYTNNEVYGYLFPESGKVVIAGYTYIRLFSVHATTHAFTLSGTFGLTQIQIGYGHQVCRGDTWGGVRLLSASHYGILMQINTGATNIEMVESIGTTNDIAYRPYAMMVDDDDSIPCCYSLYVSSTIYRTYTFIRADSGAYVDGHYYVHSSSQAARIVIGADEDGIATAGINCTVPSGGTIRFAISLDGTNWLYWNGSANVALASLAAIKTNGALHTFFQVSLQALELEEDDELYVAFALYRPVTMDEALSPYIEDYWVIPSGGEVISREWRVENGEVRASPGAATPNAVVTTPYMFGILDPMK